MSTILQNCTAKIMDFTSKLENITFEDLSQSTSASNFAISQNITYLTITMIAETQDLLSRFHYTSITFKLMLSFKISAAIKTEQLSSMSNAR